MSSLANLSPHLAAYHTALSALAVFCLAVLIQSVLAGALGLGKSDEVPGRPLKGTHADRSFRILRTYGNSVESLPAFATTVFLAIIAGVSAFWVNWLAVGHVAFRLIYWFVYYAGIGRVAGGPRTIAYALGWLMNIALAVFTVLALSG